MISVAAVGTAANLADLGTKRLPCHTMRKLMYMVGVYNDDNWRRKSKLSAVGIAHGDVFKRFVQSCGWHFHLLEVFS